MKISIIIPVYHEEKTIIKVLKKINRHVKTNNEILVIYDKDNDPTFNVVKKYKTKKSNIKLIKNSTNSGIGVMNAIKTGILKSKAEVLVITMADLSDDITQVDQMYALIKKGYDIICPSRYVKYGKKIGGPFIKTLLSRVAGLSLYYIFKVPTHDSTNAFKMYRRKIFKDIKIESTGGFEYSLEIVLKAYKKGYKITEIPTIWKDREEGKSRFKLIKWLPNYIKTYLQIIK